MSAFTTKTAVLALILLFPGEPVLIGFGLFMIFYDIIYALLENDARRILAYSIVNKDSGLRPKDAPWNMAAAMIIFAALCIVLGGLPLQPD